MATKEQVLYSEQSPESLADLITTTVVVTGGAAAATTTIKGAREIVAIQAYITASGAPATKCLLTKTTDYTFATGTQKLTYVTNQSANTLLVTYK